MVGRKMEMGGWGRGNETEMGWGGEVRGNRQAMAGPALAGFVTEHNMVILLRWWVLVCH